MQAASRGLKKSGPALFQRSAAAGFTLLEVLLAMVITAFIAMMAYQGWDAALTAAKGEEAATRQMEAMQLMWTVLGRDIRHAVDRPVVDSYGDLQPAMDGGELHDYLLRLTRSGRVSPPGLHRGGLQRVRYRLEDNKLWRESWSVLDRTNDEQGLQKILLMKNVERVQLSFLDPHGEGAASSPLGGDWVEEWTRPQGLPLAVDIRVELKNVGELHRVFSIPGG